LRLNIKKTNNVSNCFAISWTEHPLRQPWQFNFYHTSENYPLLHHNVNNNKTCSNRQSRHKFHSLYARERKNSVESHFTQWVAKDGKLVVVLAYDYSHYHVFRVAYYYVARVWFVQLRHFNAERTSEKTKDRKINASSPHSTKSTYHFIE